MKKKRKRKGLLGWEGEERREDRSYRYSFRNTRKEGRPRRRK